MSEEPDEAFVAAAAALQGLQLDPEALAAVVANVKVLRSMAAQFVELDLPLSLDPAAVLRL